MHVLNWTNEELQIHHFGLQTRSNVAGLPLATSLSPVSVPPPQSKPSLFDVDSPWRTRMNRELVFLSCMERIATAVGRVRQQSYHGRSALSQALHSTLQYYRKSECAGFQYVVCVIIITHHHHHTTTVVC